MKKVFYTIIVLVVLFFGTTVLAQDNPPLTDEEMFDFSMDETVEGDGGEEGNHPAIVAPKVVDKPQVKYSSKNFYWLRSSVAV